MKTKAERHEAWTKTFTALLVETVEKTGVKAPDFKVGGRASKAWPNRETGDWWMVNGFEQAERYIDWLQETGWKIATLPDGRPGIEWDGEVVLAGNIVRFVIDAVYETDAGELVVVDYKSGSHTPSGLEQLALYATALEIKFGVRPKWGAFYMTRKSDLAGLHNLDPWGIDHFNYQFTAMQRQMELGMWPMTVADHCGFCGYREYCPGANGSKAIHLPITHNGDK